MPSHVPLSLLTIMFSIFSFILVICHKLWRNNDMGSWLRLLTAYKIGLLPHWSAVGSLEVSIRDIVRCVDHRECSLKLILTETQAQSTTKLIYIDYIAAQTCRNNPEMRTCILIILVASLLADIASGCKKDKPCYNYATHKYDKACKCKDAKYNYKHPKYCGHYETLGDGCQTIDGQRWEK